MSSGDFIDRLAQRLADDPQGAWRDWGDGKISDEHMKAAQHKLTGRKIATSNRRKYAKKREPLLDLKPAPTWSVDRAVQDAGGGIHIEEPGQGPIFYQHTVLCQTSLPYKNPGDEVFEWERRNGFVHLRVEARKALHPRTQEWVRLGLPWGPKPRLILTYLNTLAIEQKSPDIEVDLTFRAFLTRIGYKGQGYDYRTMKDQLGRLSASDLAIGVPTGPDSAQTFYGRVVKHFDLWVQKDADQRLLWPSVVSLSTDYYETLVQHAVPLPMDALARLKDSALQLDIYSWLAQRLHRVHPLKPDFIPWTALYEQFGQGYRDLRFYRRDFLKHLKAVHAVYPAARIEADTGGLTLYQSAPPIAKTTYQLIKHAKLKSVR